MTNPYAPAPQVTITHPEWCKNATMYQVNTRQFSAEGTFRAVIEQLPRLQELGVSIIYLMPVQTIGELHRKGGLGSPYAVKDYYAINPEFGTPDDLKALVAAIHDHGMHVIVDWVANHTAWDNVLVETHPEWYDRDYKGDFAPTPWWDWDDIIDLDYTNPDLRRYMTEAMVHYVAEYDVDGYRCDVAGFVPLDFWEKVRAELDQVKPVLMLAEWEARDLHRSAFDLTYGWSWNEALHRIAHGKADVELLRVFYAWDAKSYPADSIRLMFVSNHDKNAWEGTEYEQFGAALEASIVLSVVGNGLPLVYNGQEAGNDRRLQFFERDPIEWRADPMADFYRKLITLRRDTSALWSGAWGATMINVPNDHPMQVLSFVRADERSKVFAAFNFSPEPQLVNLHDEFFVGHYVDLATDQRVALAAGEQLELPAWGWQVLVAANS